MGFKGRLNASENQTPVVPQSKNRRQHSRTLGRRELLADHRRNRATHFSIGEIFSSWPPRFETDLRLARRQGARGKRQAVASGWRIFRLAVCRWLSRSPGKAGLQPALFRVLAELELGAPGSLQPTRRGARVGLKTLVFKHVKLCWGDLRLPPDGPSSFADTLGRIHAVEPRMDTDGHGFSE